MAIFTWTGRRDQTASIKFASGTTIEFGKFADLLPAEQNIMAQRGDTLTAGITGPASPPYDPTSDIIVKSELDQTLGLLGVRTKIPKGIYSTLNWDGATDAQKRQEVRQLQQLGTETIRINCKWQTIETAQGVFNWTLFDRTMRRARQSGADIILQIEETPAWARAGGTSAGQPPTNNATMASFCTALATRYAGQVYAYQVWNEANVNWALAGVNAAAFVGLVAACSTALRAADRGARVVPGGIASNPGYGVRQGDTFLSACLSAGLANHVDALCFHPYSLLGQDPAARTGANGVVSMFDFTCFTIYKSLMDAAGVNLPIWITEYGYTTVNSVYGANGGLQWVTGVSETAQAEYLTKSYELACEYPYIEQLLWYAHSDAWTNGESWSPDYPGMYFGLFKFDRTPKLAAAAFERIPNRERSRTPIITPQVSDIAIFGHSYAHGFKTVEDGNDGWVGIATLAKNSTAVTARADWEGTLVVGQAIEGDGILPGTYVAALPSGTTITLSQPAEFDRTLSHLVAGQVTKRRWSSRVARALGARERNFGVSGGTASYDGYTNGGGGYATALAQTAMGVRLAKSPKQPIFQLVCIQHGINDWGAYNNLNRFKHAMRTMICASRVGSRYESGDASVALTGATWTSATTAGLFSGKSAHYISAGTISAAQITITVPATFQGGEIDLGFVLAPDSAGNRTDGVYAVAVDSVAHSTLDTRGLVPSGTKHLGVTHRLQGLSAGAHSIVVTFPTAPAGTVFFDYWQVASVTPPTVLLLEQPKLTSTGYSPYAGAVPVTDARVDAGNQALREVAQEFTDGLVRTVSLADLDARPGMFAADEQHPSADGGHPLIAQAVLDEIAVAPPTVECIVGFDPVRITASL